MSFTLWHNLLFISSVFPGALVLILDRIALLKKTNQLQRYLIAMGFVIVSHFFVTILDPFFQYVYFALALIILTPVALFMLEQVLEQVDLRGKYNKKSLVKKINNEIQVLLLIPICEELIFRAYQFHWCKQLLFEPWWFVGLSAISFTFAHYFTQGFLAFRKIPFATVQAVVLLVSGNILICIFIHCVFNLLVYLKHSSTAQERKTQRGFFY